MAEFDYERIENILWDDFAAAAKEKTLAMDDFNSVIGEIPSGLPQPDGTQRIKNASKRNSEARQRMIIALDKLNAFRNRGIVPDEMKANPAEPKER